MDAERAFRNSQPVAPPLYTSSVFALPDLDALERISDGIEPGYMYARDKHPNAELLSNELRQMHGSQWCSLAASGMGALAATMLALLKNGDRVVASDQLYGRTSQLLGQELRRFDIATQWVDSSNLDEVRASLRQPAKVLLVETISNPLLRVANIPALAEIAHGNGCLLIADNTFATPVLFQPLKHGADLAVESLTKMIGGHSDLTLGATLGQDSDLHKRLTSVTTIWGMSASPFDCWQATRSLATVKLRVHAAVANAARLAEWLKSHPKIIRTIYPGLSDHPDRALASRLFAGSPGNIICAELAGGREAVNQFMRKVQGIPFCPSLGDSRTTCSYPFGTSHRYVESAEKSRLGITDGLIRLSIGIEPFEEIHGELEKGLAN